MDPSPNAIPDAFGDFVRQITKGGDKGNLMRQRAIVLVRHVFLKVGGRVENEVEWLGLRSGAA